MASERMTVREHLTKAIREHDPRRASAMVDYLRFKRGLKYADIYAMVHELTGISEGEWEGLMYEADCLEGEAK